MPFTLLSTASVGHALGKRALGNCHRADGPSPESDHVPAEPVDSDPPTAGDS